MGIRVFLILTCCLLVAIPAALFWAGPQTNLENFEVELATDRHQRIAEELSSRLEYYGHDVNAIVSLMALQKTHEAPPKQATALLKSKYIGRVCVYDAKSLTLTRSVLAAKVPCRAALDQNTFERLLKYTGNEGSRFTPVEIDHAADTVLFLPMLLQTEFVVAAIYPGYLQKIGSSIRFGANGHVALVDQQVNVLSHPNAQWNDTHKNLAHVDAFREVTEGKTGIKHFESPALKAQMIAGTHRVPVFGWGVLVPQPVEELHAIVDRFDTTGALVVGFGVLLALLTALAVGRVIGGPLEEFTNAATAVSNGDLDAEFPRLKSKWIPRELRVATTSLKRMTKVLQRNSADLQLAANSDSLTGLPNRKAFTEQADDALQQSKTKNSSFSVLFVDLNRFKAINDSYGHRRGDELLVAIARRIQALARSTGDLDPALWLTAGRLGGDEFAIAVCGLETPGVHTFAKALVEQIERPFPETGDHSIGCSVGIASRVSSRCELFALLHRANLAMYQAKKRGDNQIVFYQEPNTDIRATSL